jgi:hypothetical protein
VAKAPVFAASAGVEVAQGATASATATCPAGTKATGGGYTQDDVVFSFPYFSQASADGNSWTVKMKNNGSSGADTFTAHVVCIPIG